MFKRKWNYEPGGSSLSINHTTRPHGPVMVRAATEKGLPYDQYSTESIRSARRSSES
jgi:hypothetical protein